MRDQLFETITDVGDFVFDDRVVEVFDDMVGRSVPMYAEVQRMVIELATYYLAGGSGSLYDIGSSTGTTLAGVVAALPDSGAVRLVGIEPAEAMRASAGAKLGPYLDNGRMQLVDARIEDLGELTDAKAVTMLFTLQFVRPLHRAAVLSMIHRSLRPGGCLLLAEKILADDMAVRRLFIDLYHDYKHRAGYSADEIARKRESLENVLVPFTDEENLQLLAQAGFGVVEHFFRWYNWAGYLAVKAATGPGA